MVVCKALSSACVIVKELRGPQVLYEREDSRCREERRRQSECHSEPQLCGCVLSARRCRNQALDRTVGRSRLRPCVPPPHGTVFCR